MISLQTEISNVKKLLLMIFRNDRLFKIRCRISVANKARRHQIHKRMVMVSYINVINRLAVLDILVPKCGDDDGIRRQEEMEPGRGRSQGNREMGMGIQGVYK